MDGPASPAASVDQINSLVDFSSYKVLIRPYAYTYMQVRSHNSLKDLEGDDVYF